MDWKEYEIYITRHFQHLYPGADIKHNVSRLGVVSQTQRQIDILVDAKIIGVPISIIIDCKYFKKKVDINDVESFLSFLRDLKASKGIMITNIGYTEAAHSRATNDTQDIELHIINFSNLEQFQAFTGIPWSGGHAAIVSAPEGWVLDAKPKGPYVASLYPLGLSQAEALSNEGFIYIVFSHKDSKWPNLDHLLKLQDELIRKHYRLPRIEYVETIKRNDCPTRLRLLETAELEPRREYTLFLDFPEVILFLNILVPRDKDVSYRKKLEWVGEKLIKGKATKKER